jgi:hypothetical protein
MEGKLKQVNEFEMARFTQNPDALYENLFAQYKTPEMNNLVSSMMQLQASPHLQRIRERALAGLPPDEADAKAYRDEMDRVMKENQTSVADLQSGSLGRSKDGRELSLHKSWHCLHYLLTGQALEQTDSPLGKAILGGEEIPDRRGVMGYGPARYLTPKQVQEVAAALREFPIADRAAAFDARRAEDAKVYVPDHAPEELVEYFGMLRDFYLDAMKNKDAVVLWLE